MKINKFHLYYPLNKNIENFDLLDYSSGDVGAKGYKGIEGQIGDRGPTGLSGMQGATGDKGEIGPRGSIGIPGIPGTPGLIGEKGNDGMKGIRGIRGIQGPPGPLGEPGTQGPPGFQGIQGQRGDTGDTGLKGNVGDEGYNGFMSVDYAKCYLTDWTYDHLNSTNTTKFDSKWNTEVSINCNDGDIATDLETECFCFNSSAKGKDPDTNQGYKKCNSMFDERDCKHRLKCCPIQSYDISEPVSLSKDRLSKDPGELERILNIMWIQMEPFGLNKKIEDYPELFYSKADYNINKINSNDNESINSFKFIDKIKNEYEEIPITKDCNSSRCSIVGQTCSENKVCIDSINPDTECKIPPCWHSIPRKLNSCSLGKCNKLGQYCDRDGGRICMNYRNIEEGCNDPPCWRKVPVLESCNGKRCNYEGQQCTGNTDKMNLAGFFCKNEPNEFYINDQCTKAPCWHKLPDIVDSSECQDKKCKFIGQKCRIGGTDEDPLYKICLNDKTSDCPDPPCWFDSGQMIECTDTIEFCEDEYSKNSNGELILDSFGKPIIKSSVCDYKGSCPIRGQRCKLKPTDVGTTGSSEETVIKECVNSYRYLDKMSDSYKYKSTCNKRPCWMDTNDYLYQQAKIINTRNIDGINTIKDDSLINNNIDLLFSNNSDTNVYNFSLEDKEGYITETILKNFMTKNWKIFEANIVDENFKIIWNKFSDTQGTFKIMNYRRFSEMMRLLKVEKFKFLTFNGRMERIVPRFMDFNNLKSLTDNYGVDFDNDIITKSNGGYPK